MHYQTAFSGLLDFISRSRNLVVDNSSQFHSSKNALFQFSDDHFNSYRTLIEKYEANARSTIEALAVALVTKLQIPGFSLYPVDENILAKYPNITFKSTKVQALGKNKYKITGNLTVKDVTKPVVLDAVLNKQGVH